MPVEKGNGQTYTARDGGIFLLFFAGFLLADGLLAYLTYRPSPLMGETDGFYLHAKWFFCGEGGRYFYLSHHHTWPALFVWLSALLAHLTDSTLLAGRLVSLLAGATVVGTTYLLAREYTGSRGQAAFAALLVAVNSHLLYYGTVGSTDMLAVCFSLLALLAALCAINRENDAAGLFLAGVFVSLACLTRYQYYFVFFGLLLVFAAHAGFQPRRLARNWGLLIGGFILPMAIGVVLGLSKASDIGGLAHLYRKYDLVNSMGGQGLLQKEHLLNLLAGYLRGIKLTVWVIGFLPLVGIWGAWRWAKNDSQKRWRPLVLLVPLAAYFLATGWFPGPNHIEIRRLFLLFAPVFLILFVQTFWYFFFHLLHLEKWMTTLIGVVFLVFALILSWMDLPYAPTLRLPHVGETADYYPSAFHRRLGLLVRSPFSDTDPTAIQAALAFIERENPGCRFILTDSVQASVLLPNPQMMNLTESDATIAGYITVESGYRAPEFLMLSEEQGKKPLEIDADPADRQRIKLTYLYSYDHFQFYRVSIQDKSDLPSVGQ